MARAVSGTRMLSARYAEPRRALRTSRISPPANVPPRTLLAWLPHNGIVATGGGIKILRTTTDRGRSIRRNDSAAFGRRFRLRFAGVDFGADFGKGGVSDD